LGFGVFAGGAGFVMKMGEKILLELIGKKNMELSCLNDIAESLDNFHLSGWIHRDIHPGNIFLINKKWVLGDFGISEKYPCINMNSHGVIRYIQLSSLRGEEENIHNDLFSFCLTAIAIKNGIIPWQNNPEYSLFSIKEKDEIPPNITQQQQMLLQNIINKTPGLTAAKIIEILSR